MEQKSRVLVVDDDTAIRQLLCTLIKREKVTVDCAEDGKQAIEMIEHHEYSVILLDLMMPRVDGFGVIRHLSSLPQGGKKPIVFVVTAYADDRFKEVDPRVVAGVIHKPFDVSEVGSLVRQCVNGLGPLPAIPFETSPRLAVREFSAGDGKEKDEDQHH